MRSATRRAAAIMARETDETTQRASLEPAWRIDALAYVFYSILELGKRNKTKQKKDRVIIIWNSGWKSYNDRGFRIIITFSAGRNLCEHDAHRAQKRRLFIRRGMVKSSLPSPFLSLFLSLRTCIFIYNFAYEDEFSSSCLPHFCVTQRVWRLSMVSVMYLQIRSLWIKQFSPFCKPREFIY